MPGYPHEWLDRAFFTIDSLPIHAAEALHRDDLDDAEDAFIRLMLGGRYAGPDGLCLAKITPPSRAVNGVRAVRKLEDIMGISSKFPTHQNLHIWRCPPITPDMTNVLHLKKDINSAVSVLIHLYIALTSNIEWIFSECSSS